MNDPNWGSLKWGDAGDYIRFNFAHFGGYHFRVRNIRITNEDLTDWWSDYTIGDASDL